MALVARAMEGFDLRRQFSGICGDMDTVSRQGTAEMLEQLIALRLLCGEAISDMALMREPALKALFDWDSVDFRAGNIS